MTGIDTDHPQDKARSKKPISAPPNGSGGLNQSDLPSAKPGDLGDFARFATSADAGLRTSQAVICTVGRPSKHRLLPDPRG